MRLTPDPGALPSRRGRRTLVALLILVLILLPLYLWPLRSGLGGLPGASALSGSPLDPRSPAAVAIIPSDVWDALMGRPPDPLPGAGKPRNLTMISEVESGNGSAATDADGLPFVRPHGSSPGPDGSATTALLSITDPIESTSGEADPPSSPGSFTPGASNREQGNGGGWPGGGFPGAPNSGPFGGGEPGSRGPIVTLDPGDPSVPEPTPEPATIVLIGSNLAMLAAMMWKRRRRREETESIG